MKHILLIFLLMIGLPVMAAEKVVWVAAGDLQDLFDEYELQYVNELTLKGTINGSDIKVLQNWASEYRSLNLADCRIVANLIMINTLQRTMSSVPICLPTRSSRNSSCRRRSRR